MILMTATTPATLRAVYKENDYFVFPDGKRAWRIEETFDDGAYAGSVFDPATPDLSLDWREFTPQEIVAAGLRLYGGPSHEAPGLRHC